uniref:SbsA Ig-like domain-containing protein n=1 Tax=Rhizochromulina marina TaxID=1034831 RepID=A0A7S2SQB8_9STRA|mmetsp:Transcript_4087/g.12027  ORF Transcript_4087/g.12027 Transcript_4087/m.12027 type:complete len:873 (+) Transcript_4087:59-2677(+)
MLGRLLVLLAACGLAAGSVSIVERPMVLYSSISPKLRIQTSDPVFGGVLESAVSLKFTPSLKPSAYNISIVSDTVISLALNPGKKWTNPSSADGMTLYLTDLSINGVNQIGEDVAAVATVIPTPVVKKSEDTLLYMGVSPKLVINGSNFRNKGLRLMFDPPLEENRDYIVSVKSPSTMVITRATGAKWREDPGPLKLRRIDTGGGYLRIDPDFGGVTVAEVQADLGAHGVTVQSSPEQKIYQSSSELTIRGDGFNSTSNVLRFNNGLRGKGINYTAIEHTSTLMKLNLDGKSKWRANPTNLPGPLVLLAVDAGAGFVPIGPTEAKKGRTVATVFEDPTVTKNLKVIFQTHSHELYIKGTGFTRGTYNTVVTFDPPLENGEDVSLLVVNRTHLKVSLIQGKQWISTGFQADQLNILKVMSVDTGAGPKSVGGIIVAKVKSDAEDHPSGVSVTRSTQILYQTAAIRKLIIQGSGFTEDTKLTFLPPLVKDEDYTQRFASDTKLILSLKKGKKWRPEGGSLLVRTVKPGADAVVPIGSGGQGLQVAEILQDPEIEESERIMFASHTRQLVVRGTGFSLDGTVLTLSPTKPSAYEVDSLDPTEIILKLLEGEKWAEVEEGKSVHVYVTKVDTGAGEVIMPGDGVVVAKIESDLDDNHCDDSCEWALDGMCDDGSGSGRYWWDDDYGGFYGYDDDYYGYGYYYYGDDEFLAPVCDEGTDCTDCGGPKTSDQLVDCDNSCQWANDGFCDDSRTSGLCDLGTDCHDCGPTSSSNFSTWDDDGWWDDDDNYWDIDDNFAYATRTGGSVTPASGGGGMFITVLEGLVYLIGAIICGGGTYFALKWYKGQETIPYHLAPTAEQELPKHPSTQVPITPDVHYT